MRNPSAQGEITYSVEESGISAVFPTGTSQLQWRTFTKFTETERLFLLYLSSSRYTVFPKRAMSSQQVTELRQILASRVGRADQ